MTTSLAPEKRFLSVDMTIVFGYPELSEGARRLWIVLSTFETDHGSGFASQSSIANFMGISVCTVRNWSKELIQAGLLKVENQITEVGNRNVYWTQPPSEKAVAQCLKHVEQVTAKEGLEVRVS